MHFYIRSFLFFTNAIFEEFILNAKEKIKRLNEWLILFLKYQNTVSNAEIRMLEDFICRWTYS